MKIEAMEKALGFIRRQERPFKVNLVRASFQNFLVMLTQQYQSIYIVDLGANPLQLGLVNSIGGITGSIISVPIGWLADRYGIRRTFLLGIPFMALGSLFFALSSDWLMTIPALFISLLSLQMLMTTCPMVCGTYLKKEERATGMQLCDTFSAIPGIISPMIAATMITEFGGLNSGGIRPLYILQTIGFLLLFNLVLRFYRDTIERKEPSRFRGMMGFLGDIREVLVSGKAVKRMILYRSLSNISWIVSMTYLPLFVVEVKGGDQFVLGGMTTASMIAPLLLAIPMGRLADTIGRKKVIYTMTPLYSLSILLLIYAPNPTLLLVSGLLQGFFMLGLVTQGAITQELVPTYLLGRWWGLLGLFRGVMMVLGPILGGLIWSLFGSVHVFLFILFMEVLKVGLLWLVIPETLKMKGI